MVATIMNGVMDEVGWAGVGLLAGMLAGMISFSNAIASRRARLDGFLDYCNPVVGIVTGLISAAFGFVLHSILPRGKFCPLGKYHFPFIPRCIEPSTPLLVAFNILMFAAIVHRQSQESYWRSKKAARTT